MMHLICPHPLSTIHLLFKKSPIAHFAMHHLISGINFLSRSVSLAQNTLLMMSHSLIHLPPAHHSHPPSHIHCFIPGSKLTFSTNHLHHSLLTPPDCLHGLYWTRHILLNGFHILVIFLSLYFGSCRTLSWLNCQLSSER